MPAALPCQSQPAYEDGLAFYHHTATCIAGKGERPVFSPAPLQATLSKLAACWSGADCAWPAAVEPSGAATDSSWVMPFWLGDLVWGLECMAPFAPG